MRRFATGLAWVAVLLVILVVVWAAYNGLAPQQVVINKGGGQVILKDGYRPPKVSIVCPSDSDTPGPYKVVFGGKADISSSGLPATLTLEYGDGRHYTTDRLEYFNSAYRHTYTKTGAFTVRARVQDSRGKSAEEDCSFSFGLE